MAKNKGEKKQLLGHFGRASLIVAILFLVIYLFTILSSSSSFYKDSAERSAALHFEADMVKANDLANKHFENLYAIVDRVENSDNQAEIEDIFKSYIGTDEFGDLRYYSRGKIYSASSAEIELEGSAHEMLLELASSNNRGASAIYSDNSQKGLECIAFFVPVRGSAYIDGVLSMLYARNIINTDEVINEKASAVAVVDFSGTVFAATVRPELGLTMGNSLSEFISALTTDKDDTNLVSAAIDAKEKTTCTISSPSEDYTVVVSPIPEFSNNLYLVSLSISEGLIAPELAYIRHIVNLLVIAITALIVGFIYAVLYYRKSQRMISQASLTDSRIDCPNKEQFIQVTRDVISANRRYSIALLSIHNFHYISDNVGEDQMTDILKFIAKVFETFLTDEETYGYSGDGRFLILEKYKNENSVRDKVRLVEGVVNKSDVVLSTGAKIKFDVGVYKLNDGRKRTVQEMIDCAKSACDISRNNRKNPYTVFTEQVSANVARDARMEALMETALENKEFRLFLQPKYNVKEDKIDSAEALVRWFDPQKGEYMFPGEFIDLFETNGFIVKLDHFIYIQVLEYLSAAAERGEKIVPISVNVSRVTASNDDFLDFYIGNKQRYGVVDGYVCIEFTESFAMEDYNTISDIVKRLHENGMKCSVDDFGSGYSSFSILKQIPMDELKLDRMFIKRGVSRDRDDKLLAMVIDLAKTMGMTVVQEGVETKEDFDRVVAKGCDVIQGYYYAKAIPLEEYKIFINSNTAIKYKALVK